jgi:hypothetical protein
MPRAAAGREPQGWSYPTPGKSTERFFPEGSRLRPEKCQLTTAREYSVDPSMTGCSAEWGVVFHPTSGGIYL